MKKKIGILLFALLSLFLLAQSAAFAEGEDIKVYYNGNEMEFDQPPIIKDGRTLVPMRAIFEAIGAEVEWDGQTQKITAVKKAIELKGTFPQEYIRGINITFATTIGSTVAYVNNEASLSLDVPPVIADTGRTLVPIRAISETFGCAVDWDDKSKTVIINYDDSVEKKWLPCAEGSMSRPILSIDTSEPVYWDEEKNYEVYKYKRTEDIGDILSEYKKDLVRLGFAPHLDFTWGNEKITVFWDAKADENFRDTIEIVDGEDPDNIIIYQNGAMG